MCQEFAAGAAAAGAWSRYGAVWFSIKTTRCSIRFFTSRASAAQLVSRGGSGSAPPPPHECIAVVKEMIERLCRLSSASGRSNVLRENIRLLTTVIYRSAKNQKRRAEIVREGDPSEEWFILISGKAFIECRCAFGEFGLLFDQPRTASVRASNTGAELPTASSTFN
jgi:hypothetical protein